MEKQPDQILTVPDSTLKRWVKEDAEIQAIISAHNASRSGDMRTLGEMNGVPETAYLVLQKDGKNIFVFNEIPETEAPGAANNAPEYAT